ncbi:MAG: RidA family protein [Alphaproteobacteria bacterium]|nr:RidA family protein [Alphaproteobacteria bacterium]
MAGKIEARLKELGITLPDAPRPVANYVPYVISGNLVIVSGQVPLEGGTVAFKGKVGADATAEQAKAAVQLCMRNVLAQLRAACEGDLDRVRRCLRLGGFINTVDSYTDQAPIMNGASDMVVAIFGDAGRHTRTTISVNALPLGSLAEVEGLFEIAVR